MNETERLVIMARIEEVQNAIEIMKRIAGKKPDFERHISSSLLEFGRIDEILDDLRERKFELRCELKLKLKK